MKRIFASIAVAALMAGSARATSVAFDSNLANQVVASTTNFTIDMSQSVVDLLSVQANVSAVLTTTQTFTDGQVSTAQVTIVSTPSLVAQAGTDSLVVISTNGISNTLITLNGHQLAAGVAWAVGTTTVTTASNIVTAINQFAEFTSTTNISINGSTVTITCATKGVACNSFALTVVRSSGNITASGAKFTGGQNAAYVVVGSTTLVAGTDFALGSTAVTATNLAAAINANFTSVLSTAATNQAVIYASATTAGYNPYFLFSSTPAILMSGPNFSGGIDRGYNPTTGLITLPSHGMSTGMAVIFSSAGATQLNPLINHTTYYAIAVDANHVYVSTTQALALAGTQIKPLSASTTGPHTFSLAASPLGGTITLTWQASNDNANWANLSAAAMVFASPYTAASTLWDLTTVNWRYIRANVAGPSQGGANVTIRAFGKRYGSGL